MATPLLARSRWRQTRSAAGASAHEISWLFKQAMACHQSGQMAQAISLYKRILRLKADFPECHINLGVALTSIGEFGYAAEAFRRVIALKANSPEAHLNLSIALRRQGKLEQAVAACRQAALMKPDYVEAQFNLGAALRDQGKLDEAIAAYRQTLRIKPDLAEAHSNLGVVLRHQGKLDEAVVAYRQAIHIRPDYAEAYSNLGDVLRDQGKLDEAVAACHHAIRIKCDFAEAHSNLGDALRDQGKFDEAVDAYRVAIRIRPDLAEVRCKLGVALRSKGKLNEAVDAFHQAIRIRPRYAEAYSNLGAALHDQGKLEDSVAAYRHAIRISPVLAEAYSGLGVALRDQGKFDEAIDAHCHSIRVRGDYAEAHCNLGVALRDQGKLEEAVVAYSNAIVLNPNLAQAHNNLGVTLMELGRLSESRGALEQAIQLAPRKAEYQRNLSEIVRFATGDPHLAEMERLAEGVDSLSVGDRIDLHFALGKAYEDLGRHADAFRQWLDGNALKRQQIAYDEARTLGGLDRIQAVFTSELIRTWQNVGRPSRAPVFIVGMPRSGTTLVEQILASHPHVFGAGEIKKFGAAVASIRPPGVYSPGYPDVVSNMSSEHFIELGARYLVDLERLAPDAARVVDKMPSNYILVGLIHLALPNAVIIHTIRDPVDTCISCFSKLFTEDQNYTYDLAELGRYYRHYEALMAHWHHVLPTGRILDVRYEDVVRDLEGMARRIVAHCGLDWDPRCLAFHQTERVVRTASALQVRQPIYNRAIGRWRMYEPFLGPLLSELYRLR